MAMLIAENLLDSDGVSLAPAVQIRQEGKDLLMRLGKCRGGVFFFCLAQMIPGRVTGNFQGATNFPQRNPLLVQCSNGLT